MFRAIKRLFSNDKNNTIKAEVSIPNIISNDKPDEFSIKIAKDKFINEYINDYKWRESPFSNDENDENKIAFKIIRNVQVYNIKKILQENEYLDFLLKKKNELVYVDEYNDVSFDKYDRELNRFVKNKWASIYDKYELSLDSYYIEFAQKNMWLFMLFFEYENDSEALKQACLCINSAIIDYSKELECNNISNINNNSGAELLEDVNISNEIDDIYCIEKAKERFITDYIVDNPWRLNVLDDVSEENIVFRIITYVQVYNINKILKDRNYIDILSKKLKNSIYKDEYGDIAFDKVDKEIRKFVTEKWKKIEKEFKKKGVEICYEYYINLAKLYNLSDTIYFVSNNEKEKIIDISDCVTLSIIDYQNELEVNNIDIDKSDNILQNNPIEYENFIAEKFRDLSWEVNTTKVTGDQGADLICQKDGWWLVVQCKLYSQPVGNKAVQEIYAAKEHYSANFAAVVTNTTYTESAKELSQSVGVFLLNERDIRWFDSRLFEMIEDHS